MESAGEEALEPPSHKLSPSDLGQDLLLLVEVESAGEEALEPPSHKLSPVIEVMTYYC